MASYAHGCGGQCEERGNIVATAERAEIPPSIRRGYGPHHFSVLTKA